jgi:hypothetical protein
MSLRKRIICLIILAAMVVVPLTLFASSDDLYIIDIPKAYNPFRGEMLFDFSVYDGGGIIASAILAVSDFAFLGVYFDAGNVIGSDEVSVNQPGVLARVLLSDGSTRLPPIAIGYSYFMKGEMGKVNGVIVNGFYAVVSYPYFLFQGEQNLSFGIRYPVIPFQYSNPRNITLFVGTDIEISPAFSIKGEMENIYLKEERWSEIFYNVGVDFNIVELISIDIEFKYSPSLEKMVRQLSIGYYTQF